MKTFIDSLTFTVMILNTYECNYQQYSTLIVHFWSVSFLGWESKKLKKYIFLSFNKSTTCSFINKNKVTCSWFWLIYSLVVNGTAEVLLLIVLLYFHLKWQQHYKTLTIWHNLFIYCSDIILLMGQLEGLSASH